LDALENYLHELQAKDQPSLTSAGKKKKSSTKKKKK
jgi:hypothetical protein